VGFVDLAFSVPEYKEGLVWGFVFSVSPHLGKRKSGRFNILRFAFEPGPQCCVADTFVVTLLLGP
jgi:hypothetical protein